MHTDQSVQARIAHRLDQTIFCVLLALIPLTAIPYGTVEPHWEAVFECAIFLLGMLRIVHGALEGKLDVSSRSLLPPLLAIVLLAIFQTFPFADATVEQTGIRVWQVVSADPYATLRFALKLFALVVALELLLRYTSSRKRLGMLILTVIGIGVASALFGIVRQKMQGDALGFLLPRLMAEGGYGQFINRNHFAFLMEMSLGLTLGLVAGGGVRRKHLFWYLGAALPIWVALVLANSRGGIFSMLAQLIFILLLYGSVRHRQRERESRGMLRTLQSAVNTLAARVALTTCLVIAVVAGVLWVGGDALTYRLGRSSREIADSASKPSSMRRIEIWDATWDLIKANPLVGSGFGGYWTAITEHHDGSGETTLQEAHNDYLEFLAGGGAVGAVLGAWFVIAFVRRVRGRLRAADGFQRAACFGALAGLFGVAVHSLVDFGLHITINLLVAVILVAIATLDERHLRRDAVDMELEAASG